MPATCVGIQDRKAWSFVRLVHERCSISWEQKVGSVGFQPVVARVSGEGTTRSAAAAVAAAQCGKERDGRTTNASAPTWRSTVLTWTDSLARGCLAFRLAGEESISNILKRSARHNVRFRTMAVGPAGELSQQIVLLDISTQEHAHGGGDSPPCTSRSALPIALQYHHLWYPDNKHFIGAIGDPLVPFDVDDLKAPRIWAHLLENAHELRWDSIDATLHGDLGPDDSTFDRFVCSTWRSRIRTKRAVSFACKTTLAHCVAPTKPWLRLTYSFITDTRLRLVACYVREYIYEVDLPTGQDRPTWSCGAEFPAPSFHGRPPRTTTLYASGREPRRRGHPAHNLLDKARVVRTMPLR